MKIRYLDVYIINSVLSKYLNKSTYSNCQIYSLNALIFLSNTYFRNSFFLKCKKQFKNSYSYYIFKFLVLYMLLNCSKVASLNKFKAIYIYLYYFELYIYLNKLFNIFIQLLNLNENLFCLNSQLIKNIYTGEFYSYKKTDYILNFILRNKVKFILVVDLQISKVLLHKLSDFDICFFSLNLSCIRTQFMFLGLLYFLKESWYNKFVTANLLY